MVGPFVAANISQEFEPAKQPKTFYLKFIVETFIKCSIWGVHYKITKFYSNNLLAIVL